MIFLLFRCQSTNHVLTMLKYWCWSPTWDYPPWLSLCCISFLGYWEISNITLSSQIHRSPFTGHKEENTSISESVMLLMVQQSGTHKVTLRISHFHTWIRFTCLKWCSWFSEPSTVISSSLAPKNFDPFWYCKMSHLVTPPPPFPIAPRASAKGSGREEALEFSVSALDKHGTFVGMKINQINDFFPCKIGWNPNFQPFSPGSPSRPNFAPLVVGNPLYGSS